MPKPGAGSRMLSGIRISPAADPTTERTSGSTKLRYAVPTNGTFGNSGRNTLNGPGLTNVNFSLGKSFAIWEQVHLQVRADANNVFNHPSFGLPGAGLTVLLRSEWHHVQRCDGHSNRNFDDRIDNSRRPNDATRRSTLLLINSLGMAVLFRHPDSFNSHDPFGSDGPS